MEHLLLKAATTAATDQGIFEAVISTASVDRDGDIIEPAAIVKALTKWAELGKKMPLAYSHRDPATGQAVVVGHIDPASARIEGQEVITKGWVDQSTDRGAETWRLVKSGSLSFSYGYLVPDGGATKRAGKRTGYHVTEIDLYEVSVVPVGPANNDTRVLSFKATETAAPAAPAPETTAEEDTELQEVKARLEKIETTLQTLTKAADTTDQEPSEQVHRADPLRRQADDIELKFASNGMSLEKPPAQVAPPPRADLVDLAELKQRMRDDMLIHLNGDIE